MNTIIEKIRAEVERLKGLYNPNDYDDAKRIETLAYVEDFLSDLEKQPIDEEFEKKKISCSFYHKGLCSAYEYYSIPCDGNCKHCKQTND